jgi:hypothetical protein
VDHFLGVWNVGVWWYAIIIGIDRDKMKVGYDWKLPE